MKNFCYEKNQGHFWTLFWSKIWPFSLKNQVFGHFLWNPTLDLSKTWSETGDNCFESSNGSVVSGKILVLAVLAILGSIYIAYGDIICFWAVCGHFLPNCWWFFVNICYLNQVYCLKMVNEDLSYDKKIWAIFGPFLVHKLAIFSLKTQVSYIFLETAHQINLKLC